jgi:hypothetical protein
MATRPIVFSHWFHLLDGVQESPQNFYSSLEASIQKRELPDVSISRVRYREGGLFSAKREYLRVRRKSFIFDICGAPFGKSFFVSWWLGEKRPVWGGLLLLAVLALIVYLLSHFIDKMGLVQGLIASAFYLIIFFLVLGFLIKVRIIPIGDSIVNVPIIGPIYELSFRLTTYYKIDTALMFQESVHAAVLESIDQIIKANGIRALSELERKPILTNLLKR